MTGKQPAWARLFLTMAAGLAGQLLLPADCRADEPPLSDGVFITVRYPLEREEVGRIIELSNLARQHHRNRIQAEGLLDRAVSLKIVYDFTPDGQPSGTSPYGDCRDLAVFLLSVHDATTIAFAHGEVTGHAVLPVLACQELVMSGTAKLGDAARNQTDLVGEDQEVFYRNVADKRGRSPALILKMLKKDLEVFQATRNGGVWFVDGNQEPEPGLIIDRAGGPLLPKGNVALLTTDQALKFGLCRLSRNSREEVAGWYQLPPASLREDPLLGRTRDAWLIEVRGPLNRMLEETLKRRLSRVVGQKANFIVLQLECGGGDPAVAGNIADFIRELKDNTGKHSVMTVAYVTEHAQDTAVFLALACTQIVMHKDAKLGDFENYLKNRPNYEQPLSGMLKGLAEKRYYPPQLVRGLVEPDLVLYRAKSQKNPLERTVVSEQDLRDEPGRWVAESNTPLKPKGKLLTLDAALAKELGIVQHVVEKPGQALEAYRLNPQTVRQAGPDWLDRVAAFLRQEWVRVILIGLGIACLILELKMPGVGLPGVISGICFILFFWAHAQLPFTWLAILAFLLGLVFIGLEIFVVPGFGVLGVSGIVLVLGGLGLATMENWPQTDSDWADKLTMLGWFGLTLVGAMALAITVARYLPQIPYANRMVLVPPTEKVEGGDEEPLPVSARQVNLLGAIGVAATPLRPAGMVRFGDDYLDVVAEGSYVQPGARVQVVEIEGNRIVVKEV